MKINDYRDMSVVELNAECDKNELFNLRFQHVTGQLENALKLRTVKKDIARVKTIIREKEIKKAD